MDGIAPNKYSRGKIYKIISPETEKIYIGSTIEPTLANRLGKHKYQFKSWNNGAKLYVSSFKLLELPNYQIVLIELYPCTSKDELTAREQHYLNLHKDIIVNHQKANSGCKTDKEYNNQYYQENKEHHAVYFKEYNEKNKEKVAERKKEYQEKNKEHLAVYIKEYQEKNKARLQEQHSITYTCECGTTSTIAHKQRHLRSKTHLTFIEHGMNYEQPKIFTCECGTTLTICKKNRHCLTQKHIKFIEQKNAIVMNVL